MDTKSALTLKKEEGRERMLLFRAPTMCQALSHKCFPIESSYRTLQQLEDVIFLKENQNGMGLGMLTLSTGRLSGPGWPCHSLSDSGQVT